VEASNGITEQTGRAGASFGRQVEQLMATAQKAADTARQLDESHDRAHTGKFLDHTAYVIEQLHSIAVDIARLYQPSVEEELWKRYYKGDQGVFLRHITKTLSRQKFEAIQRTYQTDEKFRGYVMRYLKEYSALIKHARATDHAEVLTTTFSTSDMGKLYMVLSKAMDVAAFDQAS
jgi:mRNA degradation ribonuclease J1/J2